TPFTSGSFAVTAAVSAEELMDRSVIALVLSPESTSTVKRFMTSVSTKFLTLLLTADSDKPISLPMSTNDFLESSLRMSKIFWSRSKLLLSDTMSFLLCYQKGIHFRQGLVNHVLIHY